MKVFAGTFVALVFHVQCMVCMMMVISVLRMHRQMRHLARALCHGDRSEHCNGLPHKDEQKKECANAYRHEPNCSSASLQVSGLVRQ